MTSDLFQFWFDNVLILSVKDYQKSQNRRDPVILLLDNAVLTKWRFSAVFLPPNGTSLVEPMDQCVIALFKRYYRQDLLRRVVDPDDDIAEQQFHLLAVR